MIRLAGVVMTLLLVMLASRSGLAVELRPYDAPRVDASAHVPPVPPEYLVHDEGWIHFAYHPSARERVRPLIAQAEEIRAEITGPLGRDVLSYVEVRVAAVPAEMARLSPADLPSYAPAVAFGSLRLIVMSLSSPLSLEPPDLEEVFRHQLAHIALDDALRGAAVPRWFHEGYAVHVSGELGVARMQTLSLASLRGRMVGVNELETSFPVDAPQASTAYAASADFVRFLLEKPRASGFRAFTERMRAGEDFERALGASYGSDVAGLERTWREDVARLYSFVPVLLAGVVLWVLVAAVVLVRRARQRRAPSPLPGRRARKIEARGRPSAGDRASIHDKPRVVPGAWPPRADPRPEGVGGANSPPGRVGGANSPPFRVLSIGGREIAEREEVGEPILRDPDVPKVEHDGRWHTLH